MSSGFDPKTKHRITKSGEPHTLPFYAPEMREFLNMALSIRNPTCPHVFEYRGKQVISPRTGFENARRAAALEHVNIHDIRRTAVRNMIRAGIDKKRAKQISGHLTDEVLDRYDITTEEDAVDTGRTMRDYMHRQQQKAAEREQLGVNLGAVSSSKQREKVN